MLRFFYIFFFFQAEDGIRDKLVTGVQTCALPISPGGRPHRASGPRTPSTSGRRTPSPAPARPTDRAGPHRPARGDDPLPDGARNVASSWSARTPRWARRWSRGPRAPSLRACAAGRPSLAPRRRGPPRSPSTPARPARRARGSPPPCGGPRAPRPTSAPQTGTRAAPTTPAGRPRIRAAGPPRAGRDPGREPGPEVMSRWRACARGRGGGGQTRGGAQPAGRGAGRGRPPLAHLAAGRPAGDMEHSAFEADEETEQLGEPGAVQRAGGAVGRRLYGERVAHARDGDVALAPQLTGEHGAGRAPGGYVPESPGAGARGEPGEHEEAPYGPSRRATAGVREYQVRIGPAPHQPEQRLDMRRVGRRAAPDHALVHGQLHSHRARIAEPLAYQLISELRQPVLDRRVEVPDRLEDGEGNDAVDHGR